MYYRSWRGIEKDENTYKYREMLQNIGISVLFSGKRGGKYLLEHMKASNYMYCHNRRRIRTSSFRFLSVRVAGQRDEGSLNIEESSQRKGKYDMKSVAKTEITPDMLVQLVKSRKVELELILQEKEHLLRVAPEGSIRIILRKKSFQYYHRKESSDIEGIYLKREQDDIATALVQKDYDTKLIGELKKEINSLEIFLRNYRPERIADLYTTLHHFRRPLVHPAMLLDEDYVARWKSVEYPRKAFAENAPDFFTANGERVRSKSEIMIADALNRHNIPYRYEYPMHLAGTGVVHPDFTCLNVPERKEFLWEHNGMMSDTDYSENAIKRIGKYTLAGFHPGKNLILTFETSSCPLSSRIIDSNINCYFL